MDVRVLWAQILVVLGAQNGETFQCEGRGRFPDLSIPKCRRYALCTVTTTGHPVALLFTCPVKTAYDPVASRCRPQTSFVCGSDSFICIVPGVFPHPSAKDCSAYYSCFFDTFGDLVATEHHCPAMTLFDPMISVCSPSYICPNLLQENVQFITDSTTTIITTDISTPFTDSFTTENEIILNTQNRSEFEGTTTVYNNNNTDFDYLYDYETTSNYVTLNSNEVEDYSETSENFSEFYSSLDKTSVTESSETVWTRFESDISTEEIKTNMMFTDTTTSISISNIEPINLQINSKSSDKQIFADFEESNERFECSSVGRYPKSNIINCDKYVVCSLDLNGELKRYEYSCPSTTKFNPYTSECEENYKCVDSAPTSASFKSIDSIFSCSTAGRFSDASIEDCKGYIVCVNVGNRFISYKYTCPGGSLFDPISKVCKMSYICNEKRRVSTNSPLSTIRKSSCIFGERHLDRDVKGCKGYIVCARSINGKIMEHKYLCPESSIYDPNLNECSATYKCADTIILKKHIKPTVLDTKSISHKYNFKSTKITINTNDLHLATCTSAGRYPDTTKSGCKFYIVCAESSDGKFISYKYNCPGNTFFDPDTNECSATYKCSSFTNSYSSST